MALDSRNERLCYNTGMLFPSVFLSPRDEESQFYFEMAVGLSGFPVLIADNS
jgi:hypothetical protein